MFTFIETKLFTRLALEYLTDEEYRVLQALLIEQPLVGQVVPGSGLAKLEQGAIWPGVSNMTRSRRL